MDVFFLGPFHVRAKSRDHEVVGIQKKVSKGRPKTPPNYVVWSRFLKCSVKSCVTGPSIKCYLNGFLFIWVLAHDKIE